MRKQHDCHRHQKVQQALAKPWLNPDIASYVQLHPHTDLSLRSHQCLSCPTIRQGVSDCWEYRVSTSFHRL
eukprot:1599348-Amphidinium_carterae.1